MISFKQMYLCFVTSLEYFWVITRMKWTNNFQIAKVQPKVLLSFCLIFSNELGVAYKVLLTKKACNKHYTSADFFVIKNIGWFLLMRFVDLVRLCHLHIISRNHSNTVLLMNMQKINLPKVKYCSGLFVLISRFLTVWCANKQVATFIK